MRITILALLFIAAATVSVNAEGGGIGGTLQSPSETTGAENGPSAAGNACGEGGEVVGLDPRGDGFLSVRDGPGGQTSAEIDRITNGQSVTICARRGPWLSVTYDRSGGDCRTRSRSCRSGWVFSRYVRIAEPIGGGPTVCDALWTRRNAIYKQAGYCFLTPRAIAAFGNSGCRYDRLDEVPLSPNERRTVSELASEERAASCAP